MRCSPNVSEIRVSIGLDGGTIALETGNVSVNLRFWWHLQVRVPGPFFFCCPLEETYSFSQIYSKYSERYTTIFLVQTKRASSEDSIERGRRLSNHLRCYYWMWSLWSLPEYTAQKWSSEVWCVKWIVILYCHTCYPSFLPQFSNYKSRTCGRYGDWHECLHFLSSRSA